MKKKRPRSVRKYRLPSGTETTRPSEYVKAWRNLGKPLADFLGLKLHAFDPDLAIGPYHSIPVDVAKAFNVHHDALIRLISACHLTMQSQPFHATTHIRSAIDVVTLMLESARSRP